MPKSKKVKATSKKKNKQLSLGAQIGKVLLSYFTTQFILMILVGVATWGILTFLNVEYALLLGIITGILSGIPNIGMFFATVGIVAVTVLDQASFWPNSSPILEGVIVVLIFVVFNKLVDFLLAPIFLGKVVKLNPIILFFVIILGTIFLGPLGAILAVPLVLVIRTIIQYYSK